MEILWKDGIDGYKENRLTIDEVSGKKSHHLTLHDAAFEEGRNFVDAANDILSTKNKVSILFSGGQDSELALRCALQSKIKFQAITMRLMLDDCLVNSHDIYYSEKFCRSWGITHDFVSLDIKKFFDSGKYLEYCEPYHINEPHVATHLWLIEQCKFSPVMAGDYTWPWHHQPLLSPHRLQYSSYNRFMTDRGIDGIGSFLNHSLEINMHLIDKHLKMFDQNIREIGKNKANIYSSLGLGSFEPRLRNSGWEGSISQSFNKSQYKFVLMKMIGNIPSTISWGSKIQSLIKSDKNENDRFH